MTKPADFTQPELCYQDTALLAVFKPAGLLSVPGRGPDKQDCLSSRIQHFFPEARVVHRLDMATSGLILFALGAEMQSRLGRAFQQREVYKRYTAVVSGRLEGRGSIDLPLITDWPNRPKQRVDFDSGKPALTHYTVLAYDAEQNCSRVELEPVTGRSHQLRVHLAALGHPIVGDALYGSPTANGRMLLHACELRLAHPVTGAPLCVLSAPPF